MQYTKYLLKHWKLQAAVIFFGLISSSLALINPYLTKLIIDKAYANKQLRLFFVFAVSGGLVFIISGLINFLSSYFSKRINFKVNFELTRDIFRHFQALPMSFYNDRACGEHLYKMNSDLRGVSDFISNAIPQAVTLLARLLFTLAVIFYLNWKLALLVILLLPVSYAHHYSFGKWLKKITRQMIEKMQDVFKKLYEVFSHMHLIRSFGKENYEIRRFEKDLSLCVGFEIKNAKILGASAFLASVFNKAIVGIILLYGGYQVIKGTMTLGGLTAIMIYLAQVTGLVVSIGRFYENMAVNFVSWQRLSEILDIAPEIKERKNARDCSILKGKIEFREVGFAYKPEKLILKNISFSITAGAKIAIVGSSGCGKTTLMSLLLRLYDIDKGAILIDGIDIRNIKLQPLKSQIGIALELPFLWNDTIASNILYGKEDATRQELVAAAKIAQAHDFILTLPKQYDSVIGEMGCKISEGQKQRIAIARAVIKRPKILIFDEAFSSLDSETEERIVGNIQKSFSDSTVIVISHRLSLVQKMDLVYYLEGHSLMHIGSFSELAAKSDKFQQLFAGQFSERIIFSKTN